MRTLTIAMLTAVGACSTSPRADDALTLDARRPDRTEKLTWKPSQTALIICDMWDNHWCKCSAKRCAALAPKVDSLAKACRARGILVVHCPSDVISFYEGTPQRALAKSAPPVKTDLEIKWQRHAPDKESPFPIDDSDGGCDDDPPSKFGGKPYPWTRQHAAIELKEGDAVSDQGKEVHAMFAQRGITNVIVCGVHTNFCVLGRSFGIRMQRMLGRNVVLVRDLTDSMYNPKMAPKVTHDEGTQLVIRHIEKHWCPSITADQLR